MSKKLGIVVPFRDRHEHLQFFKREIIKYLKSKNIDFELIIIEQDDAKNFNRGMLLNIGFKYAKKLKCDYVVFHDVDMLPVDVDYSYSDKPTHLASNFLKDKHINRTIFDTYFGGVTMFPMDAFENINGYSNEYWGWGFEDDDLLYRCKINGAPLNDKRIPMMGGNTAALKFNGRDAYVQCKNEIKLEGKMTLFTSFFPDKLFCNHENYDDIFSIFTIPGLDCLISYNSYNRYNFEMYDSRKNIFYINSNIKPNYKTNICLTFDFDNKEIKMYQDGELLGTENYVGKLYDYTQEEYFYLGAGNPFRETDKKYYKGLIQQFALFNNILSEDEIKEISTNQFFGLTQNFGKYESSHTLKLAYDAKFVRDYKLVDLTGNGNDGIINNCEIVGYSFDEEKVIQIPFRRNCTFKLLYHEENGYVGNGWKDVTTRYNQLKYHNEVDMGYRDTKKDGLSNLQFKEHSNTKIENQSHILVGI